MDAARSVDAVVVLPGQLLGRGVARVMDTVSSSSRSTGEVRPPLLASGATVPVSRWRRIQRRSVQGFNGNRSATAVCDSDTSTSLLFCASSVVLCTARPGTR